MDPASNPVEHVESTEKPKSKLRRSCELCREFKVRCHGSEKNKDHCQRCIKEGKKCVFLEPKPRPKRAKNSRMRVDEMEQKLESFMAMMAAGAQAAKTPPQESLLPKLSTSTAESKSAGVSSPFQLQRSTIPQVQYPLKPLKLTHPFGKSFFGNTLFPVPSFTIFDDFQDVISSGLVTPQKAQASLQHFRTTASNSPFVIISPDTSLDHLRRQKPFLLLTILAMASLDDLKLQKLLDQEIRDTLGRRVFASGEKSLDLLQGILVYLTWHHLFFEPERQQIYQLCQLAVSMAIDLEITTPETYGSPTFSTSFNLLSVIDDQCPPTKVKPSQNAESRRAFLGCYYISSTMCIGLRKPNNLKYTRHAEECCQVLAAAQEVESDKLIPYFIRLQKLADDINRTFDYDGYQELAPLEPIKAETSVQNFRQQLSQLENSFPPEAWRHDMLIMAYYHLRTFLNEVGFHKIALPTPNLMSDQSSYQTWCSSITKSEVLISCLNAAKDYLERYIALPTEALFFASFPDHAKLVYNVLILKLFSTWPKGEDLSLDAANLRNSANMVFYMESLVQKFETMGKIIRDGGLLEDYTVYLAQLFQTYKARCGINDTRRFPEINSSNHSVGHILPLPSSTQLSAHLSLLNESIHFTPQLQEESEEQWGDMLNGWSPSLDPPDLSMEVLFT